MGYSFKIIMIKSAFLLYYQELKIIDFDITYFEGDNMF